MVTHKHLELVEVLWTLEMHHLIDLKLIFYHLIPWNFLGHRLSIQDLHPLIFLVQVMCPRATLLHLRVDSHT